MIENKILEIKKENTAVIDIITFSSDNKFFFSKSKNETIIWDIRRERDWNSLAIIQENITLVTSSNRFIQAIIQDGLYKNWSKKILAEFIEDYDDQQFEF